MLNASRNYTLDAIDNGSRPGVVNSIMKYHATEKFREVMNDSMDVLGGSAIMRGPNNLLAHPYFAIPISITVEGANILTRNLMQFGQGLIKSHPFINKQIDALENDDLKAFDEAFFSHVSLVNKSLFRTFVCFFTRARFIPTQGEFKNYKRKLFWVSAQYTLLTNVVLALVGPALKKRENLSGRFGDILSYSYLITACLREYDNTKRVEDRVLVDYFCKYAFSEIQTAFEEISKNIGVLKIFVPLLRINPISLKSDDSLNNKIVKNLSNKNNLDELCKNIFISEDKSNRINVLQEAFVLNNKYTPQFKMIKNALKSNTLQRAKMSDVLQEAFVKNLISQAELTGMLEAQKLKDEVVSVDSFDAKEYKEQK